MSNKKLILISGIVGILIIGGGLWLISNKLSSSQNDNSIKEVGSNNDDFSSLVNGGQDKNGNSATTVIDSGQFEYANFLSDTDKKNITNSEDYFNLVKHQKICQAITDGQNQVNCLKNVELRQIILSGNSSLCSQTSDSDGCYMHIASTDNDVSICDNIKDNQIASACADSVNNSLALINQDMSFCKKITDNSLANVCSSKILTKLGNCEDIPIEEYRVACLSEGQP